VIVCLIGLVNLLIVGDVRNGIASRCFYVIWKMGSYDMCVESGITYVQIDFVMW